MDLYLGSAPAADLVDLCMVAPGDAYKDREVLGDSVEN